MTHYFPPGMPEHLSYQPAAVPEVLIAAAGSYGERAAVVDGPEQLSYAQLHAHALSVAAELHDAGIGPGSVVGLHLPNVLHYFTAYYGALLTGAAVTLVNPLQPAAALARQLADAGAEAVVTHPAHLAPLLEAEQELRLSRVLISPSSWAAGADDAQLQRAAEVMGSGPYRSLAEVIAASAPDFEPVIAGPDDVAHYAYTGGTTGKSKGVRVLHRNVIANITQMAAWRLHSTVERAADGLLRLAPIPDLGTPYVVPGQSATIQVPPLFHAQGLTSGGMFMLGGVTIVLAGRFDPQTFVELTNTWEAAYASGNPPMYLAVSAHCAKTGQTMPSMKLAISGAAPLDSTSIARIGVAMPNAVVGEGYGLTEATCMVTSTPVQPGTVQKVGSVGIPVCDTEIEIRDTTGTRVLPDGEEGELWVRGPQVTDGYSNAPEQTAAQYVDGWLRTGDIASRDEEGFVRIHDRAKDMLIYKGYNVYPRELEDIAAGHPEVAQVAVIGRPAGEAGEIPVAFVVARPDSSVTPESLMDWVAQRVLPYQKLREVHLVGALPTSAAGKILKTELRSLL
ncbi:class I adenylate-forming enzyme family protein [Brevibacterium daeguense]|uniref:class I adenylate-forming enzyme family protein n=1 Tax=Brevibacterium daeguense TaxID=909936 RepID=UPI001F305266|nr:AMP-binding protein [Brevibacterium daeguense]